MEQTYFQENKSNFMLVLLGNMYKNKLELSSAKLSSLTLS